MDISNLPLPDMPSDRWRIAWIQGIVRQPAAGEDAVLLRINQISGGFLARELEALYGIPLQKLQAASEEKLVIVPITALPLLKLGHIIDNGMIVSSDIRSEASSYRNSAYYDFYAPRLDDFKKEALDYENAFPLFLSTETQKDIKIERLARRCRLIYGLSDSAARESAKTAILCLKATNGDWLVIPVFEIFRFYVGSFSTNLIRKVVSRDSRINENGDLTDFIVPEESEMRDGVFSVHLKSSMNINDAYFIGRVYNDISARDFLNNIFVSLTRPSADGSAAIRVLFPFVGKSGIEVRGIRDHVKELGDCFFVFEIKRCHHRFPFKEVRLVCPSFKNSIKALIPSEATPSNFTLRVGSRKVDKTHFKTPPEKRTPLLFRQLAVAEIFPDLLDKPVLTDYRTVRLLGIDYYGSLDNLGGFGVGIQSGAGVPIIVEPYDPPMDGDDGDDDVGKSQAQPKEAMREMALLVEVSQILKKNGFSIVWRSQTHPEGYSDFSQFARSARWANVVSEKNGKLRPRLLRILEFSKIYKENRKYYYVVELESQKSAMLFFRKLSGEEVTEEELFIIKSLAVKHEGSWLTNKLGRYVTRVEIPNFFLHAKTHNGLKKPEPYYDFLVSITVLEDVDASEDFSNVING